MRIRDGDLLALEDAERGVTSKVQMRSFLAMSLLHSMLPGAGEGGREVGKVGVPKITFLFLDP